MLRLGRGDIKESRAFVDSDNRESVAAKDWAWEGGKIESQSLANPISSIFGVIWLVCMWDMGRRAHACC